MELSRCLRKKNMELDLVSLALLARVFKMLPCLCSSTSQTLFSPSLQWTSSPHHHLHIGVPRFTILSSLFFPPVLSTGNLIYSGSSTYQLCDANFQIYYPKLSPTHKAFNTDLP